MAIDEADKVKLRGQEIHDQAPPGWGKVLDKLVARFETGDFSTGAALASRIAEAADDADHHPDVDLRYPHLTVSLTSHDVGAITARDLRLAARISELAQDAGVESAAHPPDVLEIALDTRDVSTVAPFWGAILGRDVDEDEVVDAAGRDVALWFQQSDSDLPDRQRFHVDVSVPREVAEERIGAAVAAGGRLVSDERAPAFWVLADPEGNLACICTWESRD